MQEADTHDFIGRCKQASYFNLVYFSHIAEAHIKHASMCINLSHIKSNLTMS